MAEELERLKSLDSQLRMLLGERRALQDRWTLAATKVNDWPDMRRATQLLASIQPSVEHLAAPNGERESR